jgi:hypothetical protein
MKKGVQEATETAKEMGAEAKEKMIAYLSDMAEAIEKPGYAVGGAQRQGENTG